MDGSLLDLTLFLIATFAGALTSGVTGFAFGLVVSALWLHILTPLQTATLVIAYGLIVAGYAVIRLRHALKWGRLWPFVLGAAFGVPAGVAVLGWADPAHVRSATGAFLIVYSLYALLRPTLKPVEHGGAAADAGVGFLNGVLGGMTGLAGILVTIWCTVRGWPKDEQRAVFQPVAVSIFIMSAAWLGAKGALSGDIMKLFLIGLPALALGTWLGFKLYGRLDDATFRKAVLVLLLISGAALII
ncbi:MAG: sulfite exporter TauE/SafE family protein [Hyphomicrobiales bacterium]|nr:sulfite exporter TauE/SafE family protein [Hyphomicrobiales bacterium]MBV8824932.1 sulfite exporter TauE/SafE family protein [Hyphomicrobiales bacterium]MBV9429607.1 sulfite exporter TauE/SafE family protein [Bradyrhizobiaceae bacterium]